MTFDEIISMWAEDCKINHENLSGDGIKIPELHAKYYKIYIAEKAKYYKAVEDHKKLRLDKYEFLTMGPTEETKDLGWRLPPQGRILKAEVQQYIDADPDIQKSNLKVSMLKEKIDFVESIIKNIQFRPTTLRLILDNDKFKNGGY